MAKKWVISDGPPLKVRLAGTKENGANEGRTMSRPPRVRIISRIAKMLVALWVMTIGAWLQVDTQGQHASGDKDGPHDAIDGQDNPFNLI